ncbi:MAG: hypothetical protein LIP12_09535 [Clostridiales bacterium]|nr:hypothetical protein [Clostridiales bacterium]
MPTNTFDRKIEITDPESIEKLSQIMSDETPGRPLSEHPYSDKERANATQLLKEYIKRTGTQS